MRKKLFSKFRLFFAQAEQNKRLANEVERLQQLADERLFTIRYFEEEISKRGAANDRLQESRRERLFCAFVAAGYTDLDNLVQFVTKAEQIIDGSYESDKQNGV